MNWIAGLGLTLSRYGYFAAMWSGGRLGTGWRSLRGALRSGRNAAGPSCWLGVMLASCSP